jgi:hypothetical protein
MSRVASNHSGVSGVRSWISGEVIGEGGGAREQSTRSPRSPALNLRSCT